LNPGVTPNDPGDADIGENYLQNYPVLAPASSAYGSTTVQGSLNSSPNTTFRLEFFASPAWDTDGLAEGQLFLGSTNVRTDGTGEASFAVTLPVATPTNHLVTATATDPSGNTSEFSTGVEASPGPAAVSLAIRPSSGGAIAVTWPGGAAQFQLEATDALSATSHWQTVTSGVVELGGVKSYSPPIGSGSNQFFRLRRL
jgi:hypothetical protein